MSASALRPDPQVQTFGFILLPGFALMSFAAATEPLRAANLLAGRPLYEIALFGELFFFRKLAKLDRVHQNFGRTYAPQFFLNKPVDDSVIFD